MNIRDDFILKDIHEGYLVGGYVRDFLIKNADLYPSPLTPLPQGERGTMLPTSPQPSPLLPYPQTSTKGGSKDLKESLNIPKDRDIAIKDAGQFAKKLAKKYDATFIVLDDENKIYRVVLPDKENYLDISELRGKCIEDDLYQRDFTINAIAYDLANDKFVDVTGGIEDLKNKKLRLIREENLKDDPLRILRAFRFMATIGVEPDEKLINILKKHLLLINEPARERIHDEVMKLFGGKYTSKTLLKMLDIGILELIFPCVKDIKKIPPNSHHHLDLIHHLIETVRQIELQYVDIGLPLTPNPSPTRGEGNRAAALSPVTISRTFPQGREKYSLIREHLDSVDFGGYPRINHLKLAGFLHDIGKPSTWTIEESGRHRFIKHDLEGAKLVVPLLKELKFSNKQIDYISEMIRQHIYPSSVISSPNFDTKIMMRFVRKMEDNVIDIIFLARADRLSAQGEAVTQEMTENNINGLTKLLNFYLEVKPTLKPLPKLLDGNDIMRILNLKQSPILGKIIGELKEAQINGDVITKDDAAEFIMKYYKK